jgi:hypothetical protein
VLPTRAYRDAGGRPAFDEVQLWEGRDVVPLDEPEFDRWKAAAETAFRSGHAQRDACFFGWSCFMFEQAVQFALKTLLHSAGRGEKTHDLTKLWKELNDAGVDLAPSSRTC